VVLPKTIVVGELANVLEVRKVDVIQKLVGMGVMASINMTIDFDTATLVATELGFETKAEEVAAPVDESVDADAIPGRSSSGPTTTPRR
jgi:translation initiation factor IF-2